MKFIWMLISSCVIAGSAFAVDSEGILQRRFFLCSQFVFEEPGTAMIGDSTRKCCRAEDRNVDCRLYDWGELLLENRR
jgi:hypothetical protein